MSHLLTRVRNAVVMVRSDLARGNFDIPLVGMLLHPYLHRCEAPIGIPLDILLEDGGQGIGKFFFSDFLHRGCAAFWGVVDRLILRVDPVVQDPPLQQGVQPVRRFHLCRLLVLWSMGTSKLRRQSWTPFWKLSLWMLLLQSSGAAVKVT